MIFYWFCKVLVWLPLTILFPTRQVKLAKKIKGKCIFVCNHRSNMDMVIVAHKNWRFRPYVLAKQELFKNKFISSILKSYGGIPVNRKSVELSTVKKCLSILKEDKKLFIFPEGTRNEDMSEVKNGAVMFAIKTKTPIVPVYIKKKPKVFSFNKITYGEPFDLSEFYDKKLDKDVLNSASEIMENKIKDLAK